MKSSIHALFLFMTATYPAAALAEDVPEPGTSAWRGQFAVDLAATRLATLPIAPPSNALTYSVTYKGEIAGFDVGRIFLDVASSANGYAVKYRMEQKGIARWFSDAEARAQARGTFQNGRIHSHYYFNHDYEREDDQQYTELYREGGDRRLRLWIDPVYTFHQSVSEDLAEGAIDPMAAIMELGVLPKTTTGSPCNRRVKVFDGRRRFDLIMKDDGTENIKKGGKGRYQGPSYKCKLEQVKVAGYREKDRGDIDGDLWVYLTDVPEDLRTETFAFVPVMIRAKQGILTARLEGKYPTITTPGGEKRELWHR